MAQRDAGHLHAFGFARLGHLGRLGLGRRLLPQRGLLDLFRHLFDLAYHLLRRLVLSYALQGALTYQRAAGPAAEVHLDHDFRLEPFDAAAQTLLLWDLVEGRILPGNGVDLLLKFGLGLLTPPGADPAGVTQHALLVIAEQQRADQAAALVGGLV